MHRRRSVGQIIGRYFGLLRKSQRTTIGDLVVGLLRSAKAGEAAIARGMLDLTMVRHRIKRIWRFSWSIGLGYPPPLLRCFLPPIPSEGHWAR